MNVQTDIQDVLKELQQLPVGTSHRARIDTCMKHWATKGIPLATCADPRHLNRAISTVEGYARDLGLRFPDYIPWVLRTAEERKRKRE